MTQLLNEMIGLHEDRMLSEHRNMLLEYLGNLSIVDKGLVKSLTKAAYQGGNVKAAKLGPAVGQKSKVEKKIATGKNSDQLWKYFDEDKQIVAIVLEYDGEQVMAISDKSRTLADPTDHYYNGPSHKDASNKPLMYTVVTDKFFSSVMPEEEFNEVFKVSLAKNSWRSAGPGRSHELIGGAVQARTFVRKLLDTTVKKARAESKEVNVLYIYKDAERKATQNDRSVARTGRVPTPSDSKPTSARRSSGEYADYISDLKNDLKSRLDKFKAGKAKSFDSTEEMLEYVRDEGYIDKLKVKGYSYKMEDARLYFDDLLKTARSKNGKRDSYYESYVEYRLEGVSLYKLQDKLETDIKTANPDKTPDELKDQIEAAYQTLPPYKLKVMFALKGGNITATEIKAESRI